MLKQNSLMSDNQSNNKRIARNTTFLYIRMFVALIINLFTARVLLNALGVEDYGIYNVVAGFVSLFGFLNATLSSSVQRFYNYEGTQKGAEGFQNIYVTALLTHATIAAIIFVLLETFGVWYVNSIMVVSNGRLFAANILFQTSTLSMILMMMQIPYSGAVMAKEHMDFFAIISITDVVLKLIIALVVAYAEYDNLIIYAILLAIVSILDIIAYIWYCKKHFLEMKLRRYFDRVVFKNMLAFSGWNLIGTFAFMLKGQGVNMLLNFFFGPVINAARGIAYQVNGAISGFSGNIYTAFCPQLVQSYARGDYSRTQRIMFTESKVCFSLIALLTIPVIFEIEILLHIWLGEAVPEHTSLFAILVLIDSLVCTLNTPCTQVVQATGKIKYFQIGSAVVNLCLIPFCWILLSLGMTAESAFIAVIIFSCINQAVCLFLVNRQFNVGMKSYFEHIVIRCLLLVLLAPIVPILIHNIMPESYTRLILLFCTSVAYTSFIIYLCMFDKQERYFINNIVKTKFFRIKNVED